MPLSARLFDYIQPSLWSGFSPFSRRHLYCQIGFVAFYLCIEMLVWFVTQLLTLVLKTEHSWPCEQDGKTALADDVLPNGTRVKRGDMVTYSAYVMGRLERVWGPDAKLFRPERWLKDGIFQPQSPFKFTTFHVRNFFTSFLRMPLCFLCQSLSDA